jgi:hypothetical protein
MKKMTAKFSFYEVVEILPGRPVIAPVVGRRGAILGMAECDDGRWVYSVHVLDVGESWHMQESELAPTGEAMKREDFYAGDSISIEVDAETGKGRVKDSG